MLTLPISHFSLHLLIGFPFAFHLAVYERMLLFVTYHHQKISLLYIHFGFALLVVHSVLTTVQALIIIREELFCPQLMKSVSCVICHYVITVYASQ
jgi:hypothetical protein